MPSNPNLPKGSPGTDPKNNGGVPSELQTGEQKETSLKKPGSVHKHNRTVSWDPQGTAPQSPNAPPDEVKAANTESDVMSQVTNPEHSSFDAPEDVHEPEVPKPKLKGWNKVNLKDVIAMNPMESEAETYIQRALEETDPTEAGQSEAQTTLLDGVPDSSKHSFDDDKVKAEAEMATEHSHPREQGTASTLFSLAAELRRQMHQVEPTQGGTLNDNPTSSADAFAAAATSLLRRNTPKKTAEPPQPGSLDSSASQNSATKPTASSRWRDVKRSVEVTGAVVGDIKKTDKDSPGTDVEAGEVDDNEEEYMARGKQKGRMATAKEKVVADFADFEDFLRFRRASFFTWCKYMLLIILPATGVAALLFYVFDNPPCGTATECLTRDLQLAQLAAQADTVNMSVNATEAPKKVLGIIDREAVRQASISWWLLFVCVRQVIAFGLARCAQAFFIDFLCLRTTLSMRLFGSFFTLFIVQSKGWPFIVFSWGICDFCFNYGDHSFAKHWLFWQELIDLFNRTNPAGSITSNSTYLRVLLIAVVGSFIVAIKRFWVCLFLGRQTFSRYAKDLAGVMEKNLLIGQVATLARNMEKLYDQDRLPEKNGIRSLNTYEYFLDSVNEEGSSHDCTSLMKSMRSVPGASEVETLLSVEHDSSQRVKIEQLLGAFEEPASVDQRNEDVKISDIIQFRQSLSFLNTSFPFSVPFGPADTRVNCIESTEKVYKRLLLNDPDSLILKFDTLALLAVQRDGTLDEAKLKVLIKLFRPDREGNLTLLDFAKSVDSCYKQLRLLRASVANSSRIDRAFERIFNIIFYFIAGWVVLAVLGVDPVVLFATISGFVLGFAFCIGAACSKYLEGILLIIVRRPYNIGDRIALSSVDSDTSTSGSTSWFVRDVTLFTTTVCLGASNEVATYSNGSLAACRIINAARSPQAVLFFLLKFPINTSYEKLKVFKGCLEKFVTARPREWLSFLAFRATRVEADLGFVEYIVVAQHRESWQNMGALLNSKADLNSFALELENKMNMTYKSPPLPVDLSVHQGTDLNMDLSMLGRGIGDGHGGDGHGGDGGSHKRYESVDFTSIAAMFDKK